jgi:SAM-dependent MidA family methyltransferase
VIAGLARRQGPVRFDRVVELALYDADDGFYERGGGAGRGGADFITSPEVGPLFGAVLAGALDGWWRESGEPDPFVVVEAGAGTGTLAAAVLAAAPACSPALRYVPVERSTALRRRARPAPEVRGEAPPGPFDGVVMANELLDNLAFRLLQRTPAGWDEVFVGADLEEVLLPAGEEASAEAGRLAPEAPVGARVPLQHQARDWLVDALARVRRGRVVVVDYMDATPSMAARPWSGWLRTYRGHGRAGGPLEGLGTADITCEVAIDQLTAVRPPDEDRTQAEFLRAHGIDRLVEQARAAWLERAAIGDLQALKARSRVTEAAALTDPSGLGSFRVLEWRR